MHDPFLWSMLCSALFLFFGIVRVVVIAIARSPARPPHADMLAFIRRDRTSPLGEEILLAFISRLGEKGSQVELDMLVRNGYARGYLAASRRSYRYEILPKGEAFLTRDTLTRSSS